MSRPRSLTNEQLDDLRRRITNAVRFVGRKKTATETRELKRFMDDYYGGWQSKRIQKAYPGRPAHEVDRALAAFKIGLQEERRRAQKKSAAAKHQKQRDCNRWLARTYDQRNNGGARYSFEKFRNALDGGAITIPEEHAKLLTHNGELVVTEAIRLRIVAGRRDSAA